MDKADKTKTMNRIKLMQLVKEVLNEMNDQVIDADATLRTIQAAVKSGSEVTVNGKPLFKMPFVNRATIVGGGIQDFPRNERLADMDILIDGEPLQLIYKDAPQPTKPVERTPEEIEAAIKAWQDRFGPGGGVDTWRGRYTGD